MFACNFFIYLFCLFNVCSVLDVIDQRGTERKKEKTKTEERKRQRQKKRKEGDIDENELKK